MKKFNYNELRELKEYINSLTEFEFEEEILNDNDSKIINTILTLDRNVKTTKIDGSTFYITSDENYLMLMRKFYHKILDIKVLTHLEDSTISFNNDTNEIAIIFKPESLTTTDMINKIKLQIYYENF